MHLHGLLDRLLEATAEQLGLGGRGESQRWAVVVRRAHPLEGDPGPFQLVLDDVRARVAGLAGAQRSSGTLHVGVVHGEVLLDHSVYRHRGLREVGYVARRHVTADTHKFLLAM